MKKCFISFFALLACISNSYAQYIITTVAGSGSTDFTWPEGVATTIGLNNPYDVYYSPAGRYYIVHPHGVRMVDAAGMLHNIAGGNTSGYYGDGGPATAALFNNPQGIVGDTAGNLYIADAYNFVIRKINAAGIISTIAGNSTSGYSGDGGAATAAQMGSPRGITIDRIGNIYFTDGGNNCVRKINTSGIISTVAGIGSSTYGFSGDGGPATAALMNNPIDVALDTFGNLYIADRGNNRIRKVSASGIIATIAGVMSPGFSGDGGAATLAQIRPTGIAIDDDGNIFIADNSNNRVRMINSAGVITTIAGNGIAGYSDDLCNATAAKLNRTIEITIDLLGNLYLTDIGNLRIRKLTPNFVPVFSTGAVHTLTVCKDAPATSINSWLAVNDTNTGQPLAWSALTAPAHGSYAGAYTAFSAGGITVPSGLYYTPAPGYSGFDTFILSVSDCSGSKDTAALYIYVYSPAVGAGVISGLDTVCPGNTITLTSTVPGGTWVATNAAATVSAGVVMGATAGIDTILYIVNNSCLADTTAHVVEVKDCPTSIATGDLARNQSLRIFPNPNDGSFTISAMQDIDEEVSIIITNLLGENVNETAVRANKESTIKLDVANGVYFLNVVSAGSVVSRKVVIQR